MSRFDYCKAISVSPRRNRYSWEPLFKLVNMLIKSLAKTFIKVVLFFKKVFRGIHKLDSVDDFNHDTGVFASLEWARNLSDRLLDPFLNLAFTLTLTPFTASDFSNSQLLYTLLSNGNNLSPLEEVFVLAIFDVLQFRVLVRVLACEHLELARGQLSTHQTTKQLSIVQLFVVTILQILFMSTLLAQFVINLISDLVEWMDVISLKVHVILEARHFGVKSLLINLKGGLRGSWLTVSGSLTNFALVHFINVLLLLTVLNEGLESATSLGWRGLKWLLVDDACFLSP